tara:strand:+ start:963 stop:2072 length:1110 start_codon:yes stop_codon:yes gene_type:complete
MATIEYKNPLEDLFNSLPQIFTSLASIKLQRDHFAHTVQQDAIKNKRENDKAAEERDSAEIALGSGLEGDVLDKFLDTITMETATGMEQKKGEEARAKAEKARTTRVKNIIGTPIKDITEEQLRAVMPEANPRELVLLEGMARKLEGVTLQNNAVALLKELGYKDDSNPIRVVRASPALVPTGLGLLADDLVADKVKPTIQQLGAAIGILEERIEIEKNKQGTDAGYDDTRLIKMEGYRNILYSKFIQKAGIGRENGGGRYTVGEIQEFNGIKEIYVGGGVWKPVDDDLTNYPKLSRLSQENVVKLKTWLEDNGIVADNQSMERLLNDTNFNIPNAVFNQQEEEPPQQNVVDPPNRQQGFGYDVSSWDQ